MRIRHAILVASALGLGACNAADLPAEIVYDTEGWIDSAPPGPPGPKPSLTEGEDEEDEGDEGEDEGEEAGMWWSIGGVLADGNFSDLEGEFFASDGTQETCALFFGVEVLGPVSDCSACQYAWEFRFNSPETEVDIDCSGAGNVDGLTMKVGIAGTETFVDGPEGWEALGDVNEEDGRTYLDWQG